MSANSRIILQQAGPLVIPKEQCVKEPGQVLVLDGGQAVETFVRTASQAATVPAESLDAAIEMLRDSEFAAFLIDPQRPGLREQLRRFAQAQQILELLATGIAILDGDFCVTWGNPTFEQRCAGPWRGQPVLTALGVERNLGPDPDPVASARSGAHAQTRIQTTTGLYFDFFLIPLRTRGATAYMARCRDVTREVQKQRKLDALHRAGQSLAGLDPDQLAEMSIENRIELLKQNLRKSIHDVLDYHVIEIRLLNRHTNRLEPVLAEGMTHEAENRELYALKEDNGVTGYVAATGHSYLCPDTANDPHYIKGAEGARSSMTVPLVALDQVIGTFNVESPVANAFGADELQFTELFAREIAQALYLLELLTVQKYCAASESIKAVNREIALPVDRILTAATTILSRYLGHSGDLSKLLICIVDQARQMKHNIQKIGEDLAPAVVAAPLEGPVPSEIRGKRVLVVDADDMIRQSAHLALERLGCIVETAPTGGEAIALASLGGYDAIIVDIQPPDMKGYDAYKQLHDSQPQARMIMMAGFGYDAGHTLVKARQDGLRHVLFKPFLINQLVSALSSPDAPATSKPV
jgi:CheY-like chemotaxis protein